MAFAGTRSGRTSSWPSTRSSGPARAATTRLYLTLPPGSGKTLLGLEMVRRVGRPTVVLAPNTAIVGQWLDQWRRVRRRDAVAAADDPTWRLR